MLKFILATLLMSSTLPALTSETPLNVEEEILRLFQETYPTEENEAYTLLGFGLGFLLQDQAHSALFYFSEVRELLKDADTIQPELEFILSFSEVVAYDNVGMRDQSLQALGSFFLTAHLFVDDEEETEILTGEEEPVSEEDKLMTALLKDIASLAHSPDIRNLMMELAEEM